MGPPKFSLYDKVVFRDGDGRVYQILRIGGEDVDDTMEWKYYLRDVLTNVRDWAYQWQLMRVERAGNWDQEEI